jgi:hypothetical protein
MITRRADNPGESRGPSAAFGETAPAVAGHGKDGGWRCAYPPYG